MTRSTLCSFFILCIINLQNVKTQTSKTSYNARTMVVTSGGNIKFIVGLSIPLELPVSINFIQNIQYQYLMIDNATQLSYLNLLRSNEKFTLSRNTAYKALANVWNNVGMNGTSCILQMICGVAKYSLSHEGIVGAIIDTVFTPHKTSESKYKEARRLGKLGENCKKAYPVCKKNVLDYVTKIV